MKLHSIWFEIFTFDLEYLHDMSDYAKPLQMLDAWYVKIVLFSPNMHLSSCLVSLSSETMSNVSPINGFCRLYKKFAKYPPTAAMTS